MHSLTANDIIRIWEASDPQKATEQAVTIMTVAYPGESDDALRRLSLGRRNMRLLSLRERLFGSELNAFAECPQCGERLEFSINSEDLRRTASLVVSDESFDLDTLGYTVRFRVLDSYDLDAAAAAVDVDAARKILVERAVIAAMRGGMPVRGADLPEAVIDRLAARLSECDPQAETLIALACPACECRWELPLDIGSFCYVEISVMARRLLREVHTLARAYAWREADILAMSARRRHYYLELLDQ
jgi:hypothetical protein